MKGSDVLRKAVPLMALMAATALGLAACGGRSAGPAAAPSGGSQAGSAHDQALAYSRCMRAHGVPGFPDPSSSGVLQLRGVDKNSPQFRSAQLACRSLNAAGNVTPAQQAQVLAQMVKFAECMRAHGVQDYPDPHANGNGPIALPRLGGNPAEGGVPDTPVSERASRTCQHYLSSQQQPGGGS